MRDCLAVYAFNVIERNMIWKEYMEVEEGGEGAHGQVQVGEAAAEWSGGRR
jgi:hypothetical protein